MWAESPHTAERLRAAQLQVAIPMDRRASRARVYPGSGCSSPGRLSTFNKARSQCLMHQGWFLLGSKMLAGPAPVACPEAFPPPCPTKSEHSKHKPRMDLGLHG